MRYRYSALHLLVITAALAISSVSDAQENSTSAEQADLFDLSLTELMDVVIETSSKKAQRVANTAAAIYVISNEDIRRSGATTIPELLSPVPGIEVARLNRSTWAITARGFNTQFANKLLVLIDGRSVFSPMFSGVFWDIQMPFLDDIEQIEIIRGPGASVWGSNAVNGVINIITKHSGDTDEGLVVLGVGNEQQGYARARYGDRFGDVSYRSYAQANQFSPSTPANNNDESAEGSTDDSHDDYRYYQVGSRVDIYAGTNQYSLTGELYKTEKHYNAALSDQVAEQTPELQDDPHTTGGFLLGHWTQQLSKHNEHRLKIYYDWLDRQGSTFRYRQRTLDIDYHINLKPVDKHQVSLGLSFRHIEDDMDGSYAFSLDDDTQSLNDYTAFIQDEICLSDQVTATFGIKLEQTDFTGFEYQPSARLLWHPNHYTTFWGSAARAVRTPSRGGKGFVIRNGIDSGIDIPTGAIVTGELMGSDAFDSETLFAYELGFRQQLSSAVYLDLSAFFHDYKNLRTFNAQPPSIDSPYITQPFVYGNDAKGTASGAELVSEYRVSSDWKLTFTYSYFNFIADPDDGHSGIGVNAFEDQSPEHRAFLKSQHNLHDRWQLDVMLKHVGALPDDDIDAYNDIDISTHWRVTPDITLGLTGNNLWRKSRVEFQDKIQGPYRTEVERSVYASLKYQF